MKTKTVSRPVMQATQTVIRAKVNKKFAQKAERVFARHGMSTDEAINLFLAQVIEHKGIPFTVTLGGTGDNGTFWSEKIRQDSLAEVYGH